jgi:cytochrome d ubiquinol oxidase subunit II
MDLHVFWFLLLGALLAGYAVLDGFDLGVGTLHPFLARTDEERRIFLNAIGPVWDGNEVWLVTFGGALFAAFPIAYAAAFSAFYLPFMFLLFALIFRAVAIEFRSKRPERWWRSGWDYAFFVASSSSTFLLGATIGSILRGIPLDANGEPTGDLLEVITPYSLETGAFTLALFSLHGAVYLYMKTDGALQARLKRWIWVGSGILFTLYLTTTLHSVRTIPQTTANFARFPWAWGVVLVNVLALGNIPRSIYRDRPLQAFVSSGLTILCLVGLFGLAEFPNLLTATDNAAHSLTIYSAASSERTRGMMRVIAFLGLPFVLTYTAVVYWVFRGKTRLGKHSY